MQHGEPALDMMECLQYDTRTVRNAVDQNQSKIGICAGGSPPSLQQLQQYASSISGVIAPQGYGSAHDDRMALSE